MGGRATIKGTLLHCITWQISAPPYNAVRAQAMCILARVGLITPAAREAARRRQVAMRLEEQMREERRAQWMASLQGPGWARRGRCHGL